jgi:hypothetical protein
MKRIRDDITISTSEITKDLLTCWDEYQECRENDLKALIDIDMSMPLLLEAAAARLFTYIRLTRFITIGLIVTNVMWILNTIGAFQ